MLCSRLLLGLFAAGLAKASLVESSVVDSQNPIHMLVYHYRGDASGEGSSSDYELSSTKDKGAWRICRDMVPLQDKTLLQRLGMKKGKRDVYFLAYFRTPSSLDQDEQEVAMKFTFESKAGLHVEWSPAPNIDHFAQVNTQFYPDKSTKTDFWVSSKPGSVFPIGLFVQDFRRNKHFCMLPIRAFRSRWMGPRYAQPVILKSAVVLKSEPDPKDTLPPILEFVENPRGNVLLAQALSADEYKNYVVSHEDSKNFTLIGYFQPLHDVTRLVLSSSIPVEAEIHVPTLLKESQDYLIYKLKAENGEACEMVLSMDTDLLYKVVVLGPMNRFFNHEFSLYQYAPENQFVGSGVNLLVPTPTQDTKLR